LRRVLGSSFRSREKQFIFLLFIALATGLMSLSGGISASARPEQDVRRQIRGASGVARKASLPRFTDLSQKQTPSRPRDEEEEDEKNPETDDWHLGRPVPQDAVGPMEGRRPESMPRLRAGAVLSAVSPAPATSFQALADNNTVIPPDPQGAAGPDHLMVTLNSQVRIQSRTGSVISTVSINSFWSRFGFAQVFDPRILYDPYGGRWIFVALSDWQTTTSAVLIAVSQTSDPTGAWNLYAVDADPANQVFADYPRVGFNKDWIVVSVNMHTVSDNTFVRSQIYTYNKANLYAGGSGSFTLFQDGSGYSLSPAATYDNTLSTMYLVENWRGNQAGTGYLRLSSITGAVGSEVLNTGIAFPSTANPWDDLPPVQNFAPQLGSAQKIKAGESIIHGAVYRNGSIWCAHAVFLPAGGSPTRSAVQWWQLSTTGVIQQRGRIDDPAGNIFYSFPSLAVNRDNDVLVGYTRFSATQYASAAYSFRAGTDAPNTMRDDVTLKAGEAPYFKTNGISTKNKWGDYSSTVVDPANDTDMWTIQQYAAAPVSGIDRWGTWWGRVSPLSPPPPPPPPPASDVVLYASEAPVKAGNWSVIADGSAAGGARMLNPDAGTPKLSAPLANPASYFEMTFNAQAGTPYRLWIRGKAQNDFYGNDAIWVQFSGSVTSGGAATYRIGTTSGADINLEDCSGCGLSGWGWQDNGWGVGVMGPLIYFQTTGAQTIRVQNREDGLSIDQIVLSPSTYLNASPGALKNDTTILPKSGGGQPPPVNQPPQVTISASPTSGAAPLAVSFTSNATDADGQVVGYNWSFGDGGSSTQASPTRTYQNGGTFTARLTVTDNQGASAEASLVITVTNPPQASSEIIMYAAEAPVKAGGWTAVADASAAGGSRIHLPDAGTPKLSTPLASPTKYFEMTFNAVAGTPYRLWIRGKAQNDFYGNDAIWVQFSGSVTSAGAATYRIGTTSGADINLEDCSGCGLQGWGWQDNGWGVGVMGPLIYFQTTGAQTIRVQNREDGLSIDQIVLSPSTYLNASPGALKNDSTILSRSVVTPP